MRLSLTVADPAEQRRPVDVVLDLDPATSVGELADALGVPPAVIDPVGEPEREFAEAGVLEGAVLPRSSAQELPSGTVRLEVVGGPFSGETIAAPAGSRITVGSAGDMVLRILDPAVAAHHATLVIGRGADGTGPTMTVTPEDEAAPVVMNGSRLAEPAEAGADDIVQLGVSMLRLGVQPTLDADVSQDGIGHLAFNRASRIVPERPRPVVKLPGEKPTSENRSPMPWLSALIPVVLGLTMAFVFRHPAMMLMALASPVMVVGSHLTNRQLAKRNGKRTVEKWQTEIVDAKEAIAELTAWQRVQRWSEALDPVRARDVARTPTARLWERRKRDADSLTVRIGVGEDALDATFEGARTREGGQGVRVGVSPSPITVDLRQGVVGVAGPRAVTTALARAMVVQLAVSRSPRDARLVLLCEEDVRDDWEWMRWLPHLDGGRNALAAIGNTPESRLARLRELGTLLEARQKARGTAKQVEFDTDVVVLVDQARLYRTLPGMVQLLAGGPEHGIHVIALEDDRARLPEESATELVVDPAESTVARVESAGGASPRVLLDGATPAQAEAVARSLAPIVHVGGTGDDNLLPQAVRLVDLLGLRLDDPGPVMDRWRFAPRETRGVVGAGADGEFAIDLAQDGPHGLVAGTTGAGKSEFLQTFVVSLALVNRPDALTFVLVDYKGGSAFADCERLPHTVGLVTNLDGRETERALASLDAELKRREQVLRGMGAKDADAAWEKDPETAAARGLARLVLVIDEFAELKSELPEFIDGLVRIARVGRSLGVHLILATQRPSGAITPEMQSNTNLRVALRVTDKADSTDIIGSGEAALISTSTPGRGYARRGAGAAPAAFQTARVAGRRPGAAATGAAAPKVLARSWRELGAPVVFPKPPRQDAGPVDHDDTDLRAVVDVITAAAAGLGVAKNPSPWLEPLPAVLTLDALPDAGTAEAVVLGLEDVPSEQAQRPLAWDIARDSHLSFVGGARSGRTSSLRALIAQLAAGFSPADLHLYAVDFGNAALLPTAGLPHCGAVILPFDGSARLARFVSRLGAEIARRQSVLAAGSFGDLTEQRASAAEGERLAYIVVVIDGWERIASELGADAMLAFREQVIRLLREGPAVGVRLVVSGDRSMIMDKIAAFIPTRYLFPQTDREDYRTAGLPTRGLPETIRPGQVFFDTPMREAQMALLPGPATGEGQAAAFRAAVEEMAVRPLPAGARPFRVDVLPTAVTLAEALALPAAADAAQSGIVVGVGGDELSRFAVDLIANPGFVVAGNRRSGRSTALAVIGRQASAAGLPVIAVALRDSPLRAAAEAVGLALITDQATGADRLAETIAAERSRTGRGGRVLVLLDDADQLLDQPVEEAVKANDDSLSICISLHVDDAGGLFRSPYQQAKKSRQGLLLSATTAMHGTQVFGAALPRPFLGPAEPGRAALMWNGGYLEAQVPAES